VKTFGWICLLVIATMGVTYVLTRRYFPAVTTETKIEYKDRNILRRDTVTVERPVLRTVYRTVRDTVRIQVAIPRDFTFRGVIQPHPIRFSRGDVVLTYFADSSYVQDRYRIPRPRTSWGLFAFSGYEPILRAPTFGLEAVFRYQWLSVYARTYTLRTAFVTAGIRIRLRGNG